MIPAGNHRGFTLLELLAAMSIFLVICAAMFGLLQVSQQRYTSESQLSGAFQEARLAMDQIVRDINESGYPSRGLFSTLPTDPSKFAYGPVAWDPNYAVTPCFIGTAGGGTCATPGDFDLILEANTSNGVSWIRYQLVGTILYRAVVPKTGGADPLAATSAAGVMVPFVTNIMNNAPVTQLAQITANYPTMFPGGQPLPIFQYTCDTPTGSVACPLAAGSSNSPLNIRDMDITLIVMAPQPDMQSGLPRLVELNGRGHRLNPSN
jgi:prepilin-type N-terminal cleavage/methylation domain-containing protein